MRFNSKKDYSFLVIFLFVFLIYTVISFFSILVEKDFTVLIPFSIVLMLIVILFYSLLKSTYFILDKEKLICKSLIFKKTIPYSSIRKVEKQQGFYAGLKFSTAWKGLIVYYNKYDELLISPENEEDFIQELTNRTISNHIY
jgi:hypothetical protein